VKQMRIHGIRNTSVNGQFVQERRDQIVKNALKLFARKGMERTSMKDIGKACNMTSANLYNYIGKKEDLVTLVIQTTYSQLYKSIAEANEYADTLGAVEALARVIDQFFRVYDKYRENTYFVTRDFISLKPSQRLTVSETSANIAAMFEKIIKRGCAQGEFVAEDTWLAAHSIMALAVVWCLQYLVYSKRYTIDDYIKLQTEHVFRMLHCDAKVKA
jgi:TetR/AcrR family transcriptional regulator, cholesterol catabolism regulator